MCKSVHKHCSSAKILKISLFKLLWVWESFLAQVQCITDVHLLSQPGSRSVLSAGFSPVECPLAHAVPGQLSPVAGLPLPGAQTPHNTLHSWVYTSVKPCNQASKAPPERDAPKTALRTHQSKLSR